MVVQVDLLNANRRLDSGDIDLQEPWHA